MARASIIKRTTHALFDASLAISLALAVSCGSASAEERGAGPYTLGTLATLFDRAPSSPGWRGILLSFHFEGETPDDTLFPVAGVVTAGLSSTVNNAALGTVYTFEKTFLGAHYSVGAFAQFVDGKVTARILTPDGYASRTDTVTGPGDIFFLPALLAWNRGPFQLSAALPLRLPTGEFKANRLINAGTNAFAVDPSLGVSYLNEKTGFGASLIGGITFNGENPTTDYRSGSMLHVEGSVQQHLRVGPGFLGVGATGYWLHQLTADTGSGAFLGDFRARALGIGPVFNYAVQFDDGRSGSIEFKWLPELDTHNRVEGDYFWLKGAIHF